MGYAPPPPGPPPAYRPPPYPPPWPPPTYRPPTRADGLAIAATVLGIVGILSSFLFAFNILALVFGLIASYRTRKWGTRGFAFAMSGVILGTLGLVIGIGMWVTFLFDVASESDTATSRLRPGQCLDAPVDAESAHVVSCDAFHRFEVLAVLNDPTLPPEYPGREALAERARNRCSRLVAEYLGRPEDSSHLSLRAVVPTPEQWGRGDRWSACLLERADGEDLDAPLRNLTWPPGG